MLLLPRTTPIRSILAVLLLCPAGVALAEAPRAEIVTDRNAAGVRVLITHERPVSYSVTRDDNGRISISYVEPVRFSTGLLELGDPILSRVVSEGPSRLVLETGSAFLGMETFELRNPSRLVIDLTGRRDAAQIDTVELESMRPRRPSERVIVIDPGHGGIEQGAVGSGGLEEKSVTLDLALRLRSLLSRDPDVTVVLTRDEDRLVGLDERTSIANHNRADLFLSIHLNASPRASARGAETYYLSMSATDDAARTTAALENGFSGSGGPTMDASNGAGAEDQAPPADALDLVLWDLAQNRFLEESALLGERVQKELNTATGTRNRGVRQAPFRVLMGATMPAILVECGFISNPDEEARFRSERYRDRVAGALAQAVQSYLADLKRLTRPREGVTVQGGAP